MFSSNKRGSTCLQAARPTALRLQSHNRATPASSEICKQAIITATSKRPLRSSVAGEADCATMGLGLHETPLSSKYLLKTIRPGIRGRSPFCAMSCSGVCIQAVCLLRYLRMVLCELTIPPVASSASVSLFSNFLIVLQHF